MPEYLPAVFIGSNGTLRLTIEQYQFPALVEDDWDSNWLIVAGAVTIDSRKWNFKDPFLLTFEVEQLVDWLELVAKGEHVAASCSFGAKSPI
jgi:hypothetical protein